MTRLSALFAVLWLVIGPAWAVDSNGTYNVKGAGTDSCGTWTKDRSDKSLSANLEAQWVLSFVTAYNVFNWKESSDIADNVDNQGLLAWVDGYCQTNPLNSLSEASQALVFYLGVRYYDKHPAQNTQLH